MPSWRSGNTHGFCVTGGLSPIASEPTPSPRLWATPPGATPARLMRTYHGLAARPLKTGTFYFAGKRNFLLCLDKRVHSASPALPPDQPQPPVPWAVSLLGQTKQVIDVYALACQYASSTHGNTVHTDDVRAIMTTCFINLSKQGGAHVE